MAEHHPPTAVFDLDGTLVETAEDLVAALNVVVTAEGLPAISLAEGRNMVGHGARALVERGFAWRGRPLTPAEGDRQTDAFLAYYSDHLADRSRPNPNAEETLDRLAAEGWRLAVCTNKPEAFSRRLLTALGLADRFAAISGPDTFGFRKPDPRPLTETIRVAGGVPARAVMVGDSVTDLDTGVAAGVPVVLVTFGYSAVPVRTLPANRLIDDFRELPGALASLGFPAGAVVQG